MLKIDNNDYWWLLSITLNVGWGFFSCFVSLFFMFVKKETMFFDRGTNLISSYQFLQPFFILLYLGLGLGLISTIYI